MWVINVRQNKQRYQRNVETKDSTRQATQGMLNLPVFISYDLNTPI